VALSMSTRTELAQIWNAPEAAGSPGPPRLHHLFEASCDSAPGAAAVVCGTRRITYRELDQRANRLAHLLARRGAGPGRTVGILLERSVDTYVALLGVLKSGAAFVPIDPSFPDDRVAFIAEDAGLSLLLTASQWSGTVAGLACPSLRLDVDAALLAAMPDTRAAVPEAGDPLCYVIYTSGSTGWPKGVAVGHSSVCGFLEVAAPIYGVEASDRVYQGMTIAFDFSIEEIWPAWMAGATVVAGPSDSRRLGSGLADFLVEQRITVLCAVPTLLATLTRDVPSLRTLVVGGEACPRDLVERWSRPGRRMLNTYGPTETTVTATWTELRPGRPVTIGVPLPTYRVHVLDADLSPVEAGEAGELCIGGPGVARGYLNRPELTEARFVPHPLAGPRPGARLYRSGDLGRILPSGEIEYLGRIDGQVKIRGYRIELSEIEAVILEDPVVENALVSTMAPDGVVQDLVAYVTLRAAHHAAAEVRARLHTSLRRRLPAYMVPAFIEVLDALPTLAGSKAARSHLPAPTSPRLGAGSGVVVPPSTPLEAAVAGVWCRVLGCAEVSVEDDFFIDLGGHSLFAAMVTSRLREQAACAGLAIADLYAHPTVRSLARHLETIRAGAAPAARRAGRPAPLRHRTRDLVGCGAAQVGALYLLLLVVALPGALLLAVSGGRPSPALLRNAGILLPGGFAITSAALPVLARRALVGGLRPGPYPLWGSAYLRVWLYRRLLAIAPLRLLAGSPLMAPYLRLLGARIGEGCHIATPKVHLPWLVEIGDGVSIGYGADLQPFVVEGGRLRLGPVRIRSGAHVGTNAVVLAGAVVGRDAQLGEQSLAAQDQVIPPGERWVGSPSAPSGEADPLLDAMARRGGGSRWSPALVAGFVVGLVMLELLPFAMAAPSLVLMVWAAATGGPLWGVVAAVPAGPLFVLTACALVGAGKRLALPAVRPGIFELRTALGLRKWMADQLVATSLEVTNTLYATLYALPWLRRLGATVGERAEVSTAAHIDPDLLVLGQESFVADFAAVGAATFHRGQMALGRTVLGRRCFVGNGAVVRGHTRLGDSSLIGVASVPPTRPVDPETSWLGSPAIFLPRRQTLEGFSEEVTYRPPRRLVAWRLGIEYLRVTLPATLLSAVGLAVGLAELRLATRLPALGLVAEAPATGLAAGLATVLLVALVKWLVVGRYRPRVAPLWSRFVWRTELVTGLYESAAVPALIGALTGTPMIGPALRLLGARIGRRVWLDSTYLTEFDLVHVGDDAAVGTLASLQTHLFEDRVMKMSTVTVGPGGDVGSRAVVLYDAELGPGASLDALSLVMKGETLPGGGRWRGIPARAVD
jgi:non-ribosomal peptide synthetase-like protein